MKKETAIPPLGYLLRALIKAGGYRGCLVELGLDKNLDDLALETKDRQSSAFEVLQGIEDACSKALSSDCGPEWARHFLQAWFRTREAMQMLVQQVDTSPMPQEKGVELFVNQFVTPMLSGFMHLTARVKSAPDIASWWASPFQAWISFASNRTGITEETLLTNLANEVNADQRTIDRWLSGDPIGKMSWPYAPTVIASLGKQPGKPVAASDIHLLTGWLLVACAFHSLPHTLRDAVRRDFTLRKQQPWALETAIVTMNRAGFQLIIKSTTAHILHVGDSRIYRLRGNTLEQLTEDHRVWISPDKSYLNRALGISSQLEIDYQALSLDQGDIFLLTTDGVYEYANAPFIVKAIREYESDLNKAAKAIVDEAYAQGSTDNLTAQVIRIDELPAQEASEIFQQLTELPFAPILEARAIFDGYQIVREVHASSRSHVYLAVDLETQTQIIIKTPSIDLRNDTAYLERFLMEEWIARRINSAHVLKPCLQTRKRNALYIVTEFIEGQTLSQWMIDHPKPDMETVRGIVEQIARGLLAFHRMEMLHQDLRPNNIMIDNTGTVKIIDFGSTRVAGIMEIATPLERNNMLGTAQYTAPEYFLGEGGSSRSDIFSLAVITYQILSGRLPYGTQVAKSRTKSAQRKLAYASVLEDDREIPAWIDETLRKAVHPDPYKRYGEISEFLFDLRHPNKAFLNKTRPPLLEQNPVLFWKMVSFLLAVIIVILSIR